MEKPIRIKLLEHEYLIKSDENEEWVKNIAQYIHDKFGEIRENTEGLSETKTAILAAFDIAFSFGRGSPHVLPLPCETSGLVFLKGSNLANGFI